MLNGGRGGADGPAVPMSPRELAESAVAAVAAGAGEVLVHPRTPCGRESLSPRVVGPVLEELRGAGVRVPLAVPADVAEEPDPGARIERVRSWTVLPERATVRFAEPGAREVAQALLARGVAVDAVVPLGGGAGPEPLARFLEWAAPDRGRSGWWRSRPTRRRSPGCAGCRRCGSCCSGGRAPRGRRCGWPRGAAPMRGSA
ncbi:3-keto-5-aminohexanoate cleavage protein [Streptomyces sp. RerS4]|uniref:3-keto-5-aminohexanoate cleavage protein n=1 Tax=Streptomyces sp. RerS4 TaxID=2942449 RepID=UPI0032E3641C